MSSNRLWKGSFVHSMRPRAALVGLSHWHAPLYIPALQRHFTISVVTDPSEQRRREFAAASGARALSGPEAIRAEDVDVAIVLGRHDQMYAAARHLIAEGIPFLLEKPGSLNASLLADLAASAAAAGVAVAVPLVHRWGPISRALRRISRPLYFSATYIVGPPSRYLDTGNDWMLDPALSGGGPLTNVGVHFIDLFLHLTGSSRAEVKATMQRSMHGLAIEDHASLLLQTPDGHAAVLEVGYAFPAAESKRLARFSLAGSDGFVSIGPDGRVTQTSVDGVISEEWINVDSDPLFGTFIDSFATSMDDGFAGLPTLAELANSMAIVERAYSDAGFSRGTGETWAS